MPGLATLVNPSSSDASNGNDDGLEEHGSTRSALEDMEHLLQQASARSKSKAERNTLPKTNSSPLKMGLPNRKVVFQPSIFRGELLVSGDVLF